jgi:fructose-1,6-bisphosphatase/inositol monophosphatase family enzyme
MTRVSRTCEVNLDDALAAALEAVVAAREIFLKASSADRKSRPKADGSDVTAADHAIERQMRKALCARFPDLGISGEEGGHEPGSSSFHWLIDPIDGTAGFTRGVPLSAILLALMDGDDALLAVVDVPMLGWTFHAVKGGGAYQNGSRIRVAHAFSAGESLVCHGDRYTFELSGHEAWLVRIRESVKFARSYTDAFGHCLVANASAGLVVDAAMETWDRASVGLLVREAGGVVYEVPDANDTLRRTVVAGSATAVAWAQRLLDIEPSA